jgi:MFS family permease
MLIAPYFLVNRTGLSLPQAGMVLASGFVVMALISPVAGKVVARFGAGRIAPLGALVIGVGLFSVGNWRPDTSPALMVLSLAVQGCGLACFQVSYLELVMEAAPPAHRGVAGGLGMLTRTIGTVTGASLLTLVFQTLQSLALAGGEAAPEAFLSAYHTTFRLAGIVAALTGGIIAWSAFFGKTSAGKTSSRTRRGL